MCLFTKMFVYQPLVCQPMRWCWFTKLFAHQSECLPNFLRTMLTELFVYRTCCLFKKFMDTSHVAKASSNTGGDPTLSVRRESPSVAIPSTVHGQNSGGPVPSTDGTRPYLDRKAPSKNRHGQNSSVHGRNLSAHGHNHPVHGRNPFTICCHSLQIDPHGRPGQSPRPGPPLCYNSLQLVTICQR